MRLYAELPAGAQAAYSELYEITQQTEMHHSIAGLNGSVQFKDVSKSEPDLRLDFLTTARRSNRPVQDPLLKVAVQPLKFTDYLIEQPVQTAVLQDAGAVIVNVPTPGRLALHKLVVATERPLKERAKSNKDVRQAAALLDYMLAQAPH